MHRPVPGSQFPPRSKSVEMRFAGEIERAVGGSAIVLACGLCVLTVSWSTGVDTWFALKLGCGVLLAISAAGLWLRHKADEAPFVTIEGPTLRDGRQFRPLADDIAHQAQTFLAAAMEGDLAETELALRTEAALETLELTGNAVIRAIDGIDILAASVRATTAGANQIIADAVALSSIAQDTQRCIAGLDDRTAKLVIALDDIEHALQLAASLGQAACVEATERGSPGSAVARIGVELQEVVESCQPAFADASETIRELTVEATQAIRRVTQIADLISANQGVGCAVSHAVEQQGLEIGRLLTDLYEARPGFAALRSSVEAITSSGAARADAKAYRPKAALVIPARADRQASGFHSITDEPTDG